jgi:hypothetical protein
MNVDIGAEAALFPEKEYISRIFVAVQAKSPKHLLRMEAAASKDKIPGPGDHKNLEDLNSLEEYGQPPAVEAGK